MNSTPHQVNKTMKKPAPPRTSTLGHIPSVLDFDRFIPSKKDLSQLEIGLQTAEPPVDENVDSGRDERAKQPGLRKRLLEFGLVHGGSLGEGRVPFSQELLGENTPTRRIMPEPFKVLDAPFLQDDFYLNVLDWSRKNVLGVGLGNAVYTWNFDNNHVSKLVEFAPKDLISSICWNQDADMLCVGSLKGKLSVYDPVEGNLPIFLL